MLTLSQENTKVFLSYDDVFFREESWVRIMIIGDFQVQHVLRSYSRQLVDGSRASRARVENKVTQHDEITLSPESKKRHLADKITREIMTQFSNGTEMTSTGRQVLERLSREVGQPLQTSYSEEQGMFFVVPDETGQGTRILSGPENEDLKKRLFDITQSTVYNDLL